MPLHSRREYLMPFCLKFLHYYVHYCVYDRLHYQDNSTGLFFASSTDSHISLSCDRSTATYYLD
jgi:hypothetical protein